MFCESFLTAWRHRLLQEMCIRDRATQSEGVLDMIYNICMYAPMMFSAIIIVLCLLYKLDKIYPQVIADLKERDAQGIL